MLPLMIDRLIILPELNKYLGSEVFGGYIWVIGVLNTFTNLAAAGCSVLLLRDIGKLTPEKASLAVRTALVLTAVLSVVVLSLAATLSLPFAADTVRDNAWVMYGPLVGYCILAEIVQMIITVMRIRRRFIIVFLLKAAEGAVLAMNFWVAPTKLIWLVGLVYVGSMALPLVIGMMVTPEYRDKGWVDRQTAKWILTGFVGGALITFSESVQRNVARILVGTLTDSTEQVAVLYAGTSIGNIFVMPVSRLSMVILSLLAAHQTFAMAGRKGFQYVGGILMLMVLVGGTSYLAGGWLITNRYPDLADQTLQFYGWIALANAFSAALLMLRPVAIKYAPLTMAAGASVTGAVIQITCQAIFIPIYQAKGAAIGLALSAGISATLWALAYVFITRRHKAEAERVTQADQTTNP